jgi:hypothetical protein
MDLQRRWGTLTCRAILLPQAGALLNRACEETGQRIAVWRQSLSLGDQTFDLIFQDETAKANVSLLMQHHGRDEAELAVRRLCLSSPTAAGKVHLRAVAGRTGPQSFGDVFDGVTPSALMDGEFGSPPTQTITCWGDGRLNIHCASEEVMREVCADALDLTQIHLLVGLQQTEPKISLGDALNRLQIDRRKQYAAQQLLTDSSNCWSLWIGCRTQRRCDWTFTVDAPNQPVHVFEW